MDVLLDTVPPSRLPLSDFIDRVYYYPSLDPVTAFFALVLNMSNLLYNLLFSVAKSTGFNCHNSLSSAFAFFHST